MEIKVPKHDTDLLKAVAAVLRAGGVVADRIRLTLQSALAKQESISFKELMEAAPLEGIEFERFRDSGRESEFEVSLSAPM